jgi:Methylase of polypeptide chain release factors
VPGRPEDLSGLIAMEFDSFITPAGLLQAMQRDAPQVYGASNPWATHEADRERARAFARAMRSISARPARALARLPLLAGRKHFLDVGGGSGIFAVACLKAWPDLSATVLEIPSVCPLAEELAREEGVDNRLQTVAADMFRGPWPAGADTILLSQMLHDWRPEQGAELVRRPSGPAASEVVLKTSQLQVEQGLQPAGLAACRACSLQGASNESLPSVAVFKTASQPFRRKFLV